MDTFLVDNFVERNSFLKATLRQNLLQELKQHILAHLH